MLSHLERKNTPSARVLFIDFSSAFNTIILQQLVEKLMLLGVDPATCNWVFSFLTKWQQAVTHQRPSWWAQAFLWGVLSPLLFSLLTHYCKPDSVLIILWSSKTTVVGLITENNESTYRMDVEQLEVWRWSHNLINNEDKTEDLSFFINTTSVIKKSTNASPLPQEAQKSRTASPPHPFNY